MTTKEAIQEMLDIFSYEHRESIGKGKYKTEKRIWLKPNNYSPSSNHPLEYAHISSKFPEDMIESRTDWDTLYGYCNGMGYALEDIANILRHVDTNELDDEYEELLDVYQD